MNEFEYEKRFSPIPNKTYADRIKRFKEELKYLSNEVLVIDDLKGDKLWINCFLDYEASSNHGLPCFGFHKQSNVNYKTKDHLFNVFLKHFPDGVRGSLVGFPRQF
ncbi:hypothetical protein BDD43_5097 [Mucilaginibacter gracilis]|uniref:Uncharacterized protein n=1 Tax=Mucilaginibacter gracilis TaxID=423350 RepID=A0A495J8X2_9SPHI|nr:hypothetical protein [Mucilaginibacter gracilis]RKR84844.1 hypothetical protein BDD43_5097 [Mucilaginibacter gracilis]